MADLSKRKYIRFDSGVEKMPEGEAQDIEILKKAFTGLIATDFAAFKKAYPTTHARTLGIVKGKMIVPDNLPPHLKQGLFSKGGEYPVALRFNTQNHMVSSPDNMTQYRGASLKVFGVEGERLPDGQGFSTQDFNFNSEAPASLLADAKTVREMTLLHISGITDPVGMQKTIDARPDAELQNGRLHAHMTHAESLTNYSQVPYRFGDYVAKHALFPDSEAQKKFFDEVVPKDSKDSMIVTNWLTNYFAQNDAVYEWKFQLFENPEEQPIEYAGKAWDETKYPFQTVAKIVFPKQNSMDYELKAFWEEQVRMDTWKGLKAHQPVGSTNRVRKQIYPMAHGQRETFNGRKTVEVKKITELPGPLPSGVPTESSISGMMHRQDGLLTSKLTSMADMAEKNLRFLHPTKA